MRFSILVIFIFQSFASYAFEPYTAKVVRDKVRMRLSPDLEGNIIQELQKDDLVIVMGETEDFCSVAPPSDVKAYIFRTFILDGFVEGSKVNVRLEPHLDSPVIAQLNSGDPVEGQICETHSKWCEITPPSSVIFYVYKDYLEKVGDLHYISTVEERRKNVNRLLKWAYELSQDEMQKSFEEIDLEPIIGIVNEISNEYSDFSEQVKRGKDLLALIQDHYLQQKTDYLEFKTRENTVEWKEKNLVLVKEVEAQKIRLQELEQALELAKSKSTKIEKNPDTISKQIPIFNPEITLSWNAIEKELFSKWQEDHPEATVEQFYKEQKGSAKTLAGILKPYNRLVKNKPGDFLLIHPKTQTPMAFLYSTDIDLQHKEGEEVTVQVSPRPDNHFAYPAYFVHALD